MSENQENHDAVAGDDTSEAAGQVNPEETQMDKAQKQEDTEGAVQTADGGAADDTAAQPAALEDPFVRHQFLSYQGYSFPWYVALIWIIFLTSGVAYLIRNILLDS